MRSFINLVLTALNQIAPEMVYDIDRHIMMWNAADMTVTKYVKSYVLSLGQLVAPSIYHDAYRLRILESKLNNRKEA